MSLHFIVSIEDQKAIGMLELETLQSAYTAHFLLPDCSLELSLATPEEIRELNREYRQIDAPTDVLSFPTFTSLKEINSVPEGTNALIGSIIICPEKASEYKETLPQLVHHGLLHILGFDHERDPQEWYAQEVQVLAIIAKKGLNIEGVPHEQL